MQPIANKRRWLRYAAAAAVLITGIATTLILFNKSTTTKLTSTNIYDVAPGKTGATLTLANGDKVLLDSIANGIVTTQGQTTVRISDGQLVYSAGGDEEQTLYNTMSTPRGRQYQLTLPDGTQVWLNSESSITYPTAFTGTDRKVTIHGEAYFEVAKNKSMPFKVNINNQSEIEVLGTHFNVNAYTDEADIKTTLLEGSVKVRSGKNEDLLNPGQQAVINANSIKVNSAINLEEVMAWKEGYFQFNDASLSSVLKQLARWYDVDIVYESGIPNKTFVGEIPRDATLQQVLKVLEKTGVSFRINNKKIIVMQ